jgi:3-deoxy-7-phosphoheptulonate synthase
MKFDMDDLRISWNEVVTSPAALLEELPLTEDAAWTVHSTRKNIQSVLKGEDDRLMVVVGPCSIHDPEAAREYAQRLKKVHDRLADDLLIIMRVYFEKPRTTVGWKGLLNDPYLDGSFRINDGLRIGRQLLRDLAEMGVPAGTEFLDLMTPQYYTDLVSWGAIGARTTESQVHRELASGLSCPIGFKNGTSGNLQIAIEAIVSAAHPHCFLGQTKQGQSAIFTTSGNPDCHIILRGGRNTTNYSAEHVQQVSEHLEKVGLKARVMIDCSHANSHKDHTRQPDVCRDVATQLAGGDRRIIGIMLESHLTAGRQDIQPGKPLQYGQSITDSCIAWEETEVLLEELAVAARARRT